LHALYISSDFDVGRREDLLLKFGEISSRWDFEEIEEGHPLPEYFFDDGYDLSYILHELQAEGDYFYKRFTAEDLLFLELLCLEYHPLLTQGP
jgi:hypothetical protein